MVPPMKRAIPFSFPGAPARRETCLAAFAASGLALLAGCASYHPRPLTGKAVEARLALPEWKEIRLLVSSIEHPLLPPVSFDETDGLSPDEAALLAVAVHPALRALRDKRGIARAQVLQAGLLPDPRLSLHSMVPFGGETGDVVTAYEMGLQWDLSSLLSRGARREAARAEAASVDLGIAWQEWIAAEKARWSVYRLLLARKKRDAASKRVEVSRKLRDSLRTGVEIGVALEGDAAAAEAGYLEARASLAAAESEVRRARLALDRALGFPAGRMVPLQRGVRFEPPGRLPSAKELCRDLEKRRLDLLALKKGYESREAGVREAVAAQFPRIDLGILGGRDAENFESAGLEIGLRLPLFDRNRGRIALARADRKALFDEYAARLFDARGEVARLVEALGGAVREWNQGKALARAHEERAALLGTAAGEGRGDLPSWYRELAAFYGEEEALAGLEERMVDLGMALEIASGIYGLTCSTGLPGGKGERR